MVRSTNRAKRRRLSKQGLPEKKPNLDAEYNRQKTIAKNKGRWWRRRQNINKSMGGLGLFPQKDAVARGRYTRLQKFVAKRLKNSWASFGFKDIRVLDLGCGIFKKNSPTSEDFKRFLDINKVPVSSYVAVDRYAENGRKHRGVSYVKSDVIKFLAKKNISNPNIIVATRILEHIPFVEFKKFVKLYWKKLPEKGLLITDVHLFGKMVWSEKWHDAVPSATAVVPIVVQKMNGKANILFTGISSKTPKRFGLSTVELMSEIQKNYRPETPEVNDLGK